MSGPQLVDFLIFKSHLNFTHAANAQNIFCRQRQQLVNFQIFKIGSRVPVLCTLRVADVSCARFWEIPESCADGIDEIIETAVIIEEEVRQERTSSNAADHDVSKSCKTLLSTVKADRSLLKKKRKALQAIRTTSCCCVNQLVRKERALNECAQKCGRVLDSIEGNWIRGSMLCV